MLMASLLTKFDRGCITGDLLDHGDIIVEILRTTGNNISALTTELHDSYYHFSYLSEISALLASRSTSIPLADQAINNPKYYNLVYRELVALGYYSPLFT
jgi:hypothetical protein